MEIAKLLLKLLYLVVLVVLCRLILASQTPLMGMNLEVLSFFIGVLLMYFSFDYVYRFMVNNELIVQLIGSEKEEEEDDDEDDETTTSTVSPQILSRTTTEKDENVQVRDSATRDFAMDHSHKFMQDSAFALM
ncbi:MAG: hypothetical protein CMD99_04175 [Gammaproteobacteria bacterium]|nr:hypothetical protein [Gammaproteobacteria bacterium]|tara:strand:+ start:1497 stop:1895 length:399 start_codon:yes stop_codon:yes gene_type:complete